MTFRKMMECYYLQKLTSIYMFIICKYIQNPIWHKRVPPDAYVVLTLKNQKSVFIKEHQLGDQRTRSRSLWAIWKSAGLCWTADARDPGPELRSEDRTCSNTQCTDSAIKDHRYIEYSSDGKKVDEGKKYRHNQQFKWILLNYNTIK